jgi:hypothetical protein
MEKLKKLQSWITAYEKANDREPTVKEIKFKIKELLKQELKEKSSSKIYFRDCRWSDYQVLRKELSSDQKFVREYAGVDLKAYIDSAMAWSETYSKTSTDNGWLLTLRNWMRSGKREGKLIMKSVPVKTQGGHINY